MELIYGRPARQTVNCHREMGSSKICHIKLHSDCSWRGQRQSSPLFTTLGMRGCFTTEPRTTTQQQHTHQPIHSTRSCTQAVMFHNRSRANVQMKNTEELQAQELVWHLQSALQAVYIHYHLWHGHYTVAHKKSSWELQICISISSDA